MKALEPAEASVLFERCFADGDLDGMMSLYEEGASFPTPHGISTGHEQIRATLKAYLDSGAKLVFGKSLVFVAGDLALMHTPWTMTMPMGRPAARPHAGRRWRREADGSWQYESHRQPGRKRPDQYVRGSDPRAPVPRLQPTDGYGRGLLVGATPPLLVPRRHATGGVETQVAGDHPRRVHDQGETRLDVARRAEDRLDLVHEDQGGKPTPRGPANVSREQATTRVWAATRVATGWQDGGTLWCRRIAAQGEVLISQRPSLP